MNHTEKEGEKNIETGVCYKHGRVMLHSGKCKECRREELSSPTEYKEERDWKGEFWYNVARMRKSYFKTLPLIEMVKKIDPLFITKKKS